MYDVSKNAKVIILISLGVIITLGLMVMAFCLLFQPEEAVAPVINADTAVNSNTNTNAVVNSNANTNTDTDTSDWLEYNNEEYGYSVKVPEDWTLTRENEDVGNGVEYNTTFESSDYQLIQKDNGFTVDVVSGAGLNIWVQQPSAIETMEEMKEFWTLGRGGHVQQSEKMSIIDGEQALIHRLGDYETAIFDDAHLIVEIKELHRVLEHVHAIGAAGHNRVRS